MAAAPAPESGSTVPAIDSARFRQVLGHFPTGVTVITAATPAGPAGLAVGSFFSVSLDPPLVAFCAGKTSTSYPKIAEAGHFVVNVLADDQEDVSRVFASKGTDKFAGIGYHRATNTGAPVIDGVLAWLGCDIHDVHEAGDHWIVLGLVHEMEIAHEGTPLVFFRGGYSRLGS
jgi:3-hydroxy-9,10-secoandrosta-1,3,5(10)-triene-9,17-dione monooxygenase reductase component